MSDVQGGAIMKDLNGHRMGHCIIWSFLLVALLGAGCSKNPDAPPVDGQGEWASLGGDVDGTIHALFAGPGMLMAGGVFTSIGSVTATNVASWSGGSWSPLGDGIPGDVQALTALGDSVVAGATIRYELGQVVVQAPAVLKWNGMSWRALGPNCSGSLAALAVHEGALMAGGRFICDPPGSGTSESVLRWLGDEWAAEVAGLRVDAMIETPSGLYVGGDSEYGYVGQLDTQGWHALSMPLGSGAQVSALGYFGEDVIVAGAFTGTPGLALGNIARYHGGSCHPLATGLDGPVYALVVFGDDLVAAGAFTHAGDVEARNIARWDGTTWRAMGDGFNSAVYALAVYDGKLIAGGAFTLSGDTSIHGMAQWQN
jgi:hypothetical protein